MFETYPTKNISIIIDIRKHSPSSDGKSVLEYVKKSIISGIESLEDDDLVYIYRQDGELEMGRTIAESVGIVSDWQHNSVNIANAFNESLVVLGQYKNNAKKAIFYITDNYNSNNDGLLSYALILEEQSRMKCNFFIYGIGNSYSSTLTDMGRNINTRYNFTHVNEVSNLDHIFHKDLSSL
jgi:hypothetical protein